MIKEMLFAVGAALTSMGVVPLRANNDRTVNFNINTSTVAEDLSVFYNNQYPVNTLS